MKWWRNSRIRSEINDEIEADTSLDDFQRYSSVNDWPDRVNDRLFETRDNRQFFHFNRSNFTMIYNCEKHKNIWSTFKLTKPQNLRAFVDERRLFFLPVGQTKIVSIWNISSIRGVIFHFIESKVIIQDFWFSSLGRDST